MSFRGVLSGVAALLFAIAGFQMIGLRSVAGDTVAEAFYNSFGVFSLGMSALSVAVGAAMPRREDGAPPSTSPQRGSEQPPWSSGTS